MEEIADALGPCAKRATGIKSTLVPSSYVTVTQRLFLLTLP
jgi:hypothetical protein